jgi:hypothetical protein
VGWFMDWLVDRIEHRATPADLRAEIRAENLGRIRRNYYLKSGAVLQP